MLGSNEHRLIRKRDQAGTVICYWGLGLRGIGVTLIDRSPIKKQPRSKSIKSFHALTRFPERAGKTANLIKSEVSGILSYEVL